MRRTAVVLVLLVAAFGLVAAGCGQEQEQTATPETVEGSTPTETTDTETTETTETETTETTETDETETTETTETETTATTPAIEGDPVAGKEVFLGASACGGCHTLADAGSSGTVGPNLDESMPDYELALDRVTNGQGGMPSFSSTLTEQQIADVAAYVSSVAGS
ncbi:MAG TPA: c-type cytochrome [Gaiellaceae bacterium]|nr:c-type cytochrome [Gaiellaceae bacterium]